MASMYRRSPRGFTLVEMLVVIGIIGVLAALLLPAVMRALTTTRNATIAVEVNQLATAIESYKQDKGDYPPNFRDKSVVLRHIRKCYPKADPTYVTNFVNYACGDTTLANALSFIDEGESLVFWLSMTDNDPRYPFLSYFNPGTYTASPKKYYDFDESRLAAINTSEAQTVKDVGTFYDVRACLGKFAKESYYIYIDSRSYGALTVDFSTGTLPAAASQTYAYAEVIGTGEGVRPYWSTTVADSGAKYIRDQFKPINPTTFQIICAGQDGDYGYLSTDVNVKAFPTGVRYNIGDKDNITNFSNGKTLGDNMP